jgi:hypothetical protein
MKKHFVVFTVLFLILFASCATTGGADYAEGADVFAGKNWNAPSRNNMYDRWEFSAGGTFHFWHIHHGEPLDRGVYRYGTKNGVLTVSKEGTGESASYAYTVSGKTVTLTPVNHGGTEHAAVEHAPSGGHQMGALPESPVTFTEAP